MPPVFMAESPLERILIEYGLRQKQAKVYLACLEVGSGTVLKIAQAAGMPRSTTELELNHLLDRGLVSIYKKKSVKYFSADDPHSLLNLLEEKSELIQRALPKFVSIYGSNKTRPSVRFYEGRQGLKLVLGEILAEAKELISLGSAEDLFKVLEYFPEFEKKRVERKIPVKVILIDSPKARERKLLGPQQLRQVRLIPETYSYHGQYNVWNNKIAMFSFGRNLSAVVIESQELAQMQKAAFNFMWDSLEPKKT